MSKGDIRQGLTFEEWLNQQEKLPEGFREWEDIYRHWDQSNPLGWAIHDYLKRKKGMISYLKRKKKK